MSLYNAEISAGSLLLLESKRIATLLLGQPDEAAWVHAIEIENILQKKTPATARRQARLIRRRLPVLVFREPISYDSRHPLRVSNAMQRRSVC